MKKKTLLTLLIGILSLIISGCETNGFTEQTDNYEFKETTFYSQSFNDHLIHKMNQSGYDAFKYIYYTKSDENIIFSPLSLTSAIAMLEEGSDGTTRMEIRDFLNLDPSDTLGPTINQLINHFNIITKEHKKEERLNNTIYLANSLWYRNNNLTIQPDYIKIIKSLYDGDIFSIDFSDPQAKDQMNKWIDEQTNHLLKETIKNTSPDDLVYLINTLYFNGNWVNSFDKSMTKNKPFTTGDGNIIEVEMMHKTEHMPYYENDYLQLVGLKYPEGTMYILLQKDSLKQTMKTLDTNKIDSLIDKVTYERISLEVPTFDYKNETDLKKLLKEMGIPSAFDFSTANFSQMIKSNQKLKISKAFPNAKITVDEEGTEAAAVTVIGMVETSMEPKENPKKMICNKPFLFIIKDNLSKSTLFIGVVNNPNEN